MAEPWTFSGESVALGGEGVTTLVEGSSFCLSGRSGDVHPGTPHGLFMLDVRLISQFELLLNDRPPEPLTVSVDSPFTATFVARARPSPGFADSTLLVLRRRYIGLGMREDIVLRNHGNHPVDVALDLVVGCDFANLFDVKEGRDDAGRPHTPVARGNELRFADGGDPVRDAVVIGSDASASARGLRWEVHIPARGEWSTCVQAATTVAGEPIEPRYKCGEAVDDAVPATRLARWRREVPTLVTTYQPLQRAVSKAIDDLGGLRIFDPEHPERVVVAAGAPWFMTLFGRDSLLTAWMSLIVAPDLARGVLQTLADLQGTKVEPETEEEPGRILHEVRFGRANRLSLGGGHVYYGTADATPLFVMLLGELRRWGLASDVVDHLLPHADRALGWIENYGDRDGDGYVEYQRATPRGLANQGWKDSWDGVTYADGRIAEAPIALCEVQGYVYSAYTARAHFAAEAGDEALARTLRDKAARLREAFNRDFWLPDRGWYALGLDADKKPIDALASNMGHCLWTGIVDEDKAGAVAAHLVSPEMFSGWGVRTLATSMAAYNPISYHNGSVWPHDNAIAVAGLVRYGYLAEAHRIVLGLLDAAAELGGRLPELFAGVPRSEIGTPVAYPTSCSPQAWASATPLSFLRSLLRLDPGVTRDVVWVDPSLPEPISDLVVSNIPLGGHRVRVAVDSNGVEVTGLAPGVDVLREPRSPTSADLQY